MTDFATLVLKADATGLAQGEQALDSLAAKGAQTEAKFANLNRSLAKGMDDAGNAASRMAPKIQNASFQVGDFFVQIASGQAATTALAQQLPQLLGGFGMFGAVAGAAVAIGAALGPMLFDGADGAKEMADRLDDLADGLKQYESLAKMASASTEEMYRKFGSAASSAREAYQALMQIQKVEYLQSMSSTVGSLSKQLDGLRGAVTRYQGAVASSDGLGEDKIMATQIALNDLKSQFGLTADQAQRVTDALSNMAMSKGGGPRAMADAARDLGDELMAAYDAGGQTNGELLAAAKNAYEFEVSASAAAQAMGDVTGATGDATSATDDWAAAMAAVNAQLAGAYSLISAIGGGMVQRAGINAANAVLDAGGSAISAEKARRRAEEKQSFLNKANTADGFMPTDMIDAQVSEMERQWAEQDKYDERLGAVRERERASSRKGRKTGAGRKGRGERENAFERSVQDIQSQTEAFLRQADAMAQVVSQGGDWEHALAVIEEEQKLLNAAQKAGVTLTPAVRAGIKGMAEDYVNAEEAVEGMRDAQDQLKEAFERGEDQMRGFFGSILDGTDAAKQALIDLLSQMAKVQFAKGVMGLLGQTSWGAGLVRSIGSLTSYDGGGYTGSGARMGGADGKGGFMAMLHPNETVIDHTKGQSYGGGRVHVTVGVDDSGNLQVRKIAQQEAAMAGKAVSDSIPGRIKQYQINPRKAR